MHADVEQVSGGQTTRQEAFAPGTSALQLSASLQAVSSSPGSNLELHRADFATMPGCSDACMEALLEVGDLNNISHARALANIFCSLSCLTAKCQDCVMNLMAFMLDRWMSSLLTTGLHQICLAQHQRAVRRLSLLAFTALLCSSYPCWCAGHSNPVAP